MYEDDVISIEHNWCETFVILPHRTISGEWVWLEKCCIRRVWRGYYGLPPSPFTEYGTLLDVIKELPYCTK